MTPIPLTVEETRGVDRPRCPVRTGIPLPRGKIHAESGLSLLDREGAPVPAQFESLSRWGDGSVQWALIDFIVSVRPGGVERFSVVSDGVAAPPENGVNVAGDGMRWTIDSGGVGFIIEGKDALSITATPERAKGVGVGGSLRLVDASGRTRSPVVERMRPETLGPMRSTFRCDGHFRDTPLRFTLRVHGFSGINALQMELCLHNPQAAMHPGGCWDLGDPGSVLFRELAWHFAPQAGTVKGVWWRETPERDAVEGTAVEVYQDSSGGKHWDSPNHLNRNSEMPLSFRGYRLTASGTESRIGERAQPTVAAVWPGGALSVSVEQFWQNFPKALSADGGGIAVGLFPAQFGDLHELQGGERKTHRFWLSFGANPSSTLDTGALALGLRPRLEPDDVVRTGVVPFLTTAKEDPHATYRRFVDAAVTEKGGLLERREVIDEYGWRNFGDLYADHEEAYYRGAEPLVSHYNNQYDVVFGLLVHHLRSGTGGAYELARDLAHHVIDIDIYHTRRDKSAYNGGMFWHTEHYRTAWTATHRTYSKGSGGTPGSDHGGGPSNEQLYTTGLLLYHHLTGDPEAREAVIGLADWVLRMDDGRRTVLGWADGGATGYASRTAEEEYHGPGRGAGNAINALLDAATLTGRRRYLDAAEKLVARVIHPRDDIAVRRLDDPELRWSYTVFLQVLGKYLGWKEERGQVDAAYHYARQALLHYARWMADHEVPYLSRPERLEYPTETWAAQDVRKACVFDLASLYAAGAERDRFRERAGFFSAESLRTLATYPTASCTRPVAILLLCGWQRSWFAAGNTLSVPPGEPVADLGAPGEFVSQKARVKERLRSPAGWARLAAGLLRNAPSKLAWEWGRRG